MAEDSLKPFVSYDPSPYTEEQMKDVNKTWSFLDKATGLFTVGVAVVLTAVLINTAKE